MSRSGELNYMTYYHEIKTELQECDEPLTAKQLDQRIEGHRTRIYQTLKRMREKNVVISDKDDTGNGVRMYQWRQR